MHGTDADETLRNSTNETYLMFGFAGNDYLNASRNDDELHGGLGNDKLKGGDGDDWLFGDEGNDKLLGDGGADRLYGGAGKDGLQGGDGNDWLEGGRGADNLKGGDGADTFVFNISDIDAVDVIWDFDAAEGDQILITGFTSSSQGTFAISSRGGDVYLEMSTSEGAVDIAQIRGTGLEELELLATDTGLLFA